jgi:large subunit ribosomal protein L23
MSARDPRDIIIRPVVSEKSYAAYDENVYTFIVSPQANKIEIRKAVEELFGKRVDKVHTINRKGKRKRNRRTGTWGSRATQKRAIVTLVPGEDRIDIFGS